MKTFAVSVALLISMAFISGSQPTTAAVEHPRLAVSGASGSIAAYLTRFTNYVTPEDTPFPFTASIVLDPLSFTWAGPGAPLVCIEAGWYNLQADITTLGTGYGGQNNADWVVGIGRNGIDLWHMVVVERHAHSSGGTADLMSIGAPVYLDVGDRIEVFVQNPKGTSLLVESNPSDGIPNGYLTDDGTGVLSPHLIATRLFDRP